MTSDAAAQPGGMTQRTRKSAAAAALRASPRLPGRGPAPRRKICALAVAGALGVAGSGLAFGGPLQPGIPTPAVARGTLPVPCSGAGACGTSSTNNLQFVTSGAATYAASGSSGVINQASQNAILNWQSFNVGGGASVQFVQPNSTAAALNRIFDANPSVIQGSLTANGQIYLLNQNGIVFANGSQVNVAGLAATSLNISDSDFLNGILGPINEGPPRAVFVPYQDASGKFLQSGEVRIEPSAVIEADGGRVMVFAPVVTNGGTIKTPDGQTLLGGGNMVYLQASTDPNLRGLLIEVDTCNSFAGGLCMASNPQDSGLQLNGTSVPSTVSNLGAIVAERGNATLIGFAVNQSGRVSATTSVSANGSIRLLARSSAEKNSSAPTTNNQQVIASQTGVLTLGNGSVTEVLPDAGDTSTTARSNLFNASGAPVNPSSVELMGHQITLLGNASIHAPAGKVTLAALSDPNQYNEIQGNFIATAPDASARIYMDSGASIDVSGTQAVLPMQSNQLDVQLRGPELADSLLQKNGFLRGQTVTIDIRKGTPLANVQAEIDNVPVGISQATVVGGTVALKSEGDLVVRDGSSIDVSGGSTQVLPGYLNTTKLITTTGKVVDIGGASSDVAYAGFANKFSVTDGKWGVTHTWMASFGAGTGAQFYPGYVQGQNAGTIQLQGYNMVVDGNLRAAVTDGTFQRSAASLPYPGQLIIGAPDQIQLVAGTGQSPDLVAPDVLLQSDRTAHALGPNDPVPAGAPLVLSTDALRSGGFGGVSVYSNGRITLADGTSLDVVPGGAITFTGREIEVQGSLSAPAGKISLASVLVFPEPAGVSSHLVSLGPQASLDARGMWVNDNPALVPGTPAGPALPDGGTVTIRSAGTTSYSPGSVIDVSGGAWVKADGSMQQGKGGTIDIATSPGGPFGVALKGYSLSQGGTLKINANDLVQPGVPAAEAQAAPDIVISTAGSAVPGQIAFTPDFFQSGGFSSYSLSSSGGSVTLAGGTEIRPQTRNLLLHADARLQPTGSDINTFSDLATLPDSQRVAANLTLAVKDPSTTFPGTGVLTLAPGSAIRTDPKAQVTLSSVTRMVVDGEIDAPAGAITLNLPTPTTHHAFDASQAIWLGSDARLSAAGTVQLLPSAQGLLVGSVLDGGSVTLQADKGYVVTEKGSLIDVSGTSSPLDLSTGAGIARTTVASAGGAISISAVEGMLLDGSLKGAPGGASTAGGALSLFSANFTAEGPATDRFTFIHHGDSALVPSGLHAGDPIPASLNGVSAISDTTLAGSGFDQLSVTAQRSINPGTGQSAASRVVIDSGVALDFRRSVTLDAPTLAVSGSGAASVDTSYFALGNSDRSAQHASAPAADGGASLVVNANLIDLIGQSTLQGVDQVTLNSSGDVRLRGVFDGSQSLVGALTLNGRLDLTANQIYPTTFSSFTLTAQNSALLSDPASIHVHPGGGDSPVLSAGGALTLSAPVIDQSGVLKAPLGSINLNAGSQLTLGGGSLTSVSAENQSIPFGTTQNGLDWFYAPSGALVKINTPPQKSVRLSAPGIDMQPGATVNLSGGGDAYAFEFIPGTGGSSDVLANGASVKLSGKSYQLYAVVPGLQSVPYDEQYYSGTNLKAGDGVHLSGGSGLPAGDYTLLPARYALLPGAFLVAAASGYQDLPPGQSAMLPDGLPVVSGYRTVIGTDIRDSRTSGFVVMPGAAAPGSIGANTLARYTTTSANSFFASAASSAGTAVPRLPADAGSLTLIADQSLALDGTIATGAAPGARGAEINLDIANLSVVAARGPDDGTVQIEAGTLSSFGAESLLLGGAQSDTAAGRQLSVDANQVIVRQGAALSAPEVILAARNSVTVESGASVTAAAGGSPSSVPLLMGSGAAADGALLRVSSGGQAEVVRDQPARQQGTLVVNAGAAIAGNSIIADATADNRFLGTLVLDHSSVNVGAKHISLGETDGAGITQGLVFSNAQLAGEFAGASDLTLRSYETVDLYGAAAVGGRDPATGHATLDSLTIEAGGLIGLNNAGKQASLTAGAITLSNPNAAPAGAGTGTGALALNADTSVTLGAGAKSISGFGDVTFAAQQQIVTSGTGTLGVGGNLNLSAPLLTGASRSNQAIAATGAVNISGATSAPPQPADSLGAQLSITGKNITDSGDIDLPAGSITLAASGAAATDSVTLAAGALLSAAGVAKPFFDTVAYAPGGSITLTSAGGDVNLKPGAWLDVSGTAGSDAGTVSIAAKGHATIGATLAGGASGSAQQGAFNLDAGTIGDFSGMIAGLGSGGFTGAVSVRVRGAQDLVVAAGDTLRASSVKLVADNGAIAVNGTIDASGAAGGRVELDASGNVGVNAGSGISAAATGAGNKGGTVALATTAGVLNVTSGSQIDVSGGAGAVGGEFDLRAPRTGGGAGSDIAIASLAGNIVGAGSVVAEGFKTYSASTIDAAAISPSGAWFTDAASFMSNTAAIRTRLGETGNLAFHLRPGVEVDSAGSLTLSTDWSLHTWRYDPGTGAVVTDATQLSQGSNSSGALEPGVLTLRAANDLNINASLSDGFAGALATSRINDGGQSWSYRLSAGADFSGADPLAVMPQQGSVILAAGTAPSSLGRAPAAIKAVRTGTGDIEIAVGLNVVLSNQEAMIYTAGDVVQRRPGAAGDTAVYASGGGDIDIRAGGDIRTNGLDLTLSNLNPNQLITGWLQREGTFTTVLAKPTSWWVDTQFFQQSIGALGGGNVSLMAGGNVKNVSVMIPTTEVANSSTLLGGGNLKIVAGGDLQSGQFYVGHGTGTIEVGGNVTFGRQVQVGSVVPLNPILALGDGQFSVQARGDITVESVLNPTMVMQGVEQNVQAGSNSYFFTYSDNSAVNLSSLTGDVTLSNNFLTLSNAIAQGTRANQKILPAVGTSLALFVYPPTLRASALQGNIDVEGSFTLFPSPKGQVELLAGDNVTVGAHGSKSVGWINLSDVDPASLPSIARPTLGTGDANRLVNQLTPGSVNTTHAAVPVHLGVAEEPARIYALQGSVFGAIPAGGASAPFFVNKPVRVQAGQDVVDLTLSAQNTGTDDTTSVVAGRDVIYSTPRASDNTPLTNDEGIKLAGPGHLVVQAGRNVDLGSSKGIVTTANLENPVLPAQGADVTVIAGSGAAPAYDAVVASYLALYTAGSQQQSDGSWTTPGTRELDALTASLRVARQNPALTDAQVLGELMANPRAFAKDMFFIELKMAGQDRNSGQDLADLNYERGYAAIRTLFPDSKYQGNIDLFFSQIRTESGGDVNLLAPGGVVNAGLAVPPSGLQKDASQLGIVAQGEGRVRAFADGDFNVNQSRVFTLRGGDLLIWSSTGNIDAGNGAKSTISTPPPVLLTDPKTGLVTFNVAGAASGSGIRIELTHAGDAAGDVDLIAPKGDVIAGDAGIGSAGNLNIAAVHVIGADNIQAAGRAIGVPNIDTSSLASGLAGASSTASSDAARASDSATRRLAEDSNAAQAAQQEFLQSSVTVEVICTGEACEQPASGPEQR